jgi:hypothetical protein
MLSSWCQYEALSYVTFPTQTLSKSFKLVPIMLMGKLLTNKNYPLYEYTVAALIGLGNTLFMVRTHLDVCSSWACAWATGLTLSALAFRWRRSTWRSEWTPLGR